MLILFCRGLLIDVAALVDEVAPIRLLAALVNPFIVFTVTVFFVIGCRCSTTVSIAGIFGTVIATPCMIASDRR